MKEVQCKVAFVTGGAAGIGLGMAQVFVRAGNQSNCSSAFCAPNDACKYPKAATNYTNLPNFKNANGFHRFNCFISSVLISGIRGGFCFRNS